jgi:hypothetical protein
MILQVRDPDGTGPSIELQIACAPKLVKNRVHLDPVPTEGELEGEIRRLESLAARRVRYFENDPDESHWIMTDAILYRDTLPTTMAQVLVESASRRRYVRRARDERDEVIKV